MTTPYTTPSGLKIGRLHVPRQRVTLSDDALRIQAALLAERKAARTNPAADKAVELALFAGALVALAVILGWLP